MTGMATTDRLLAAVVADLEGSDRPGQQEMVDLVRDALAGHDTVLIQAGTGTGKSVGYLVPAVQHVAAEPRGQRRVVVATATLALQHQLVERDLPRLVAAVSEELPRPVSFATLKGRSNYLCLARTAGTEDADQQTLDRTTLEKQAERVVQWSASTTTGDRDELEDVSGLVWSAYSVNAQECARGSGCAFVEDCWAEKAIATARAADVVVTNHSLLALNAVQEGILGEHDAVIVDEAHSLPSALQRAATSELSVDAISRAARRSRSAGAAEESSRLLDAADAFEMALAGWDAPEGRRLAQLPAPVTQALITVREACDVTRGVLRRATESDAAGRQRAMATVDEVHTAAGELLSVDETRVMWRRRDRLVGLLDGALCGIPDGGHDEIGHGAALKLGGAFEHRMQLGADPGFEAGGGDGCGHGVCPPDATVRQTAVQNNRRPWRVLFSVF